MNQYDYGFRIYDPRIGRFLSVDPLFRKYAWYTPYQFAGNMPIRFIDVEGLEPGDPSEYVNSDAPKVDPKYTNVNLRVPKVDEESVFVKVFDGILDKAFQILGAATELPAQAHYGDKIKPEDKQEAFPLTHDQNIATLTVNTFFWPVHVAAQIKQDPTNPKVWGEAVASFLFSSLAGRTTGLGASLKAKVNARISLAIKHFAKEGIPINQTSGINFLRPVQKVKLEAGTELIQWRMEGQGPTGSWYTLPGVDPGKLGLPAEYTVGYRIKLTNSVEVLRSTAGDIENFLKPAGNGEILQGGGLQLTTRQISIGNNAELRGTINRPNK